MVIDLRFDILKYAIWLIYLCKLQQICMLLELHQLDERLTNLPIFLSDFKVLVRRLIHSSFFLKLHVHLSNPID